MNEKTVTIQVLGGQPVVANNIRTVRDAFNKLELAGNYTVSVNGDPANMDDILDEYSFVTFSPAVKGGV